MKQKWMLLCAVILLLSQVGFAQVVSADSISTLNNKHKMLEMAVTINEQKMQRAKMQNQLFQQKNDVEKTATASRKSANKNEDAASNLNRDNQDKDKANAARKSARTAQRNSSDARDAQNKMTDISEDLQSLEKKIAENEEKLTAMGGARYLE